MELRSLIDVWLEEKIVKQNGTIYRKYSRVTDLFTAFEDSEIQIERDGASGAMLSIAYTLKFDKSNPKVKPLRYAYEMFINKYNNGYSYDAFCKDDDASNSSLVISNPLESVIEPLNGKETAMGVDLHVDSIEYSIFMCYAKDESVDKLYEEEVNASSDGESVINNWSGYESVVELGLNIASYKEELEYISIDATNPPLQKWLKSKGDFDYDIPLSELSDYLKNIVMDKYVNIPIYGTHTLPTHTNDETSNDQTIYTSNKQDGDNVTYFPTINFDEVVGLPDGVLNVLTFGSQEGKDVFDWSSIGTGGADVTDYLLKNTQKYDITVRVKGTFRFWLKYTRRRGSQGHAGIRAGFIIRNNNDDNGYFTQCWSSKAYGVKGVIWNEYGTHTMKKKMSASRVGVGIAEEATITIDQYITLKPNDMFCFCCCLRTFKGKNIDKWSKFLFYLDDKGKKPQITTNLDFIAQPDTDGRTTDGNGYPIIRGIYPIDLLRYILKKKWNANFNAGEIYQKETIDIPELIPNESTGINMPNTLLIATEELENAKNPQFHINVEEILKWFKVGGKEYIIEGNNLIIGDRGYFFDNNIRKDIDNSIRKNDDVTIEYGLTGGYALPQREVGDMTLGVSSSMCYTSITLGYDKEDYDIIVGSHDAVSTFKYDTMYVSEEDCDCEMTTKIRMDSYGIIYWLIRSYDKDFDKTNDTTFALDCGYDSKNNRYNVWDELTLKAHIDQDGFQSVITYYNALRTPIMLIRMFNKPFARTFANTLKFVSSENFKSKATSSTTDNTDVDETTDDANNYVEIVKKDGVTLTISDTQEAVLGSVKRTINLNKPFDSNNNQSMLAHFSLGTATITVGAVRHIWYYNPKYKEFVEFTIGVGSEIANFANHLIRFIDDNNVVRYGFISKYTYNVYNYKSGQLTLLLTTPRFY